MKRINKIVLISLTIIISSVVVFYAIVLLFWGKGLSECSTYSVKNDMGRNLSIVVSYGGAMSADYLLIKENDKILDEWKVAGEIAIEEVYEKDDTIFIKFKTPVYLKDPVDLAGYESDGIRNLAYPIPDQIQ